MNFSDYIPVDTCQIPGLAGMLAGVFGLKDDGLFVEVGAYDGLIYSNTYQLAKLGWKGYYIEPVQSLYIRCIGNHKDHPNVHVDQAFITDRTGSHQQMYLQKDLYTGDLSMLKEGVLYQKIDVVPTMRLNDYLAWNNIACESIDLLVIDVEGFELQVLNGFTLDYYLPKMVIIEAHNYNKNAQFHKNADAIDAIFLQHDYFRMYSDEINNIYVRK